jgi:pyridoxal phosphate enzyme (YggS family)
MNDKTRRLEKIRQRVELACKRAARDGSEVRLLAVSKRQPAELIRSFHMLGQTAFGENKAQEALTKQEALKDLDIEWHFIGPVQSNKTRDLAVHFQWVQSVDRLKILQRLSAQRPPGLPPLHICLQVNIDREPQKSGLSPEKVFEMADLAGSMPNVRLRGLMAIPRLTDDERVARDSFRRMRKLFGDLQAAGHVLDTLSMGMSADLELAIEEGSTMIRIGTDLLGPRPNQPGKG